ncbi:MAG: hypothetical protein SGJ20_20460 [Planctomycetota bacterium]|nr:hypothetical protein [Planctomycetota bacterium]
MQKRDLQNDLSIHIFTVSAALVGVCLTAIGLFQIIPGFQSVLAIGDDLMALDATGFMTSCGLAYYSLRTTDRRHRVERIADAVFLLSLLLMAAICFVLVFKIT